MRRPLRGRATADGKDNIDACHTQTTRRPSRRQAEAQGRDDLQRYRPAGYGKRVEMDVQVGDSVLFAKYAGTEVKLDGDEYLVIRESDLLAIVTNGKK